MEEDQKEKVKVTEQAPREQEEGCADCECEDTGTLKAKCAEYLAGWKRAQADYANLQKDIEKMRGEMAKFAAADLVEKLLPVLDGFAAAGKHTPQTDDDNVLKWCQGISHVQVQLENILSQAGLEIIDGDAVPFDPEIHDAIMRRADESGQSDSVIEVMEQGYRLHGRVIRPAKVIVAE